MWQKIRVTVGAMAVAAIIMAGGSAASAGQAASPLECVVSDDAATPNVMCTVVGDAGASASLVTAVLMADGSERVLSTTQPVAADHAELTLPLPDDAVHVTALALVDGVETGTLDVEVAAHEPVSLGLGNVTIASAAFGTLMLGAIVVYASAHKRGVANRQLSTYRVALT